MECNEDPSEVNALIDDDEQDDEDDSFDEDRSDYSSKGLGQTFEAKKKKIKCKKQVANELKFSEVSKDIEKRIALEAIDFDWIFEGDNAKTLILLLANHARPKLMI